MPETPSSRRLQRLLLGLCAAAVASLYFVLVQPPFSRWPFAGTSMLAVHLLLELVAITVAVMIVNAAWHAFEGSGRRSDGVLVTGFGVVACCDLVHSLTYDGMPTLFGDAGTPRAIFFWLAGRTAEVATLGVLALAPRRQLPCRLALALAVLLSTALVWIGSFELDRLPATFIAGEGVTPFKAGYEYALCAANVGVAVLLWRRWRHSGEGQHALMATSAFVMGIGELAFSRYVTPSDFQNIFGHLYKDVAYLLLYRATFVASFRAPYEALQRSEARARESELRMRSLGANLPNCVVYQLVQEADGQRHFTHLSDTALQIIGVAVDDALRDPELVYSRVLVEDRAGLRAAEQRSADTMQLFDRVVRTRRPDGELRWMHLFSRPRRLDDGRIVWDGVQLDVTERHLAEDERRTLEAQLREAQKMEAIGTLAGGIAHDFNNVLGAIIGNLALARDEVAAGLKEQATQSLAQIDRAARRARDLVQKILTFSRRGVAQVQNQPLRPVVEECLLLLRATLPPGARLEARLADAPLHALIDTTELHQLVMNLCTNALQALPDGHGSVVVGLAPRRGDDGRDLVHLWVQDSGRGIDAATLPRIFEPFFTTKAADSGTGLGLAVVHGIVHARGGRVWADSAPGDGATFHVELPAQPPPAAAVASAGDGGAARSGRRTHVLYLDDDEVMGLMVERLLLRDGHEVTVFRDPLQAVAAVQAAPQRYGVVVSDYNMPQMSGLEVAERLRVLRPSLPVIITSGYVSEELETRARGAGVDGLMNKQNTLEELGAAVDAALLQRSAM